MTQLLDDAGSSGGGVAERLRSRGDSRQAERGGLAGAGTGDMQLGEGGEYVDGGRHG